MSAIVNVTSENIKFYDLNAQACILTVQSVLQKNKFSLSLDHDSGLLIVPHTSSQVTEKAVQDILQSHTFHPWHPIVVGEDHDHSVLIRLFRGVHAL